MDGDENMRLLAFAFTIVFVWTGPKRFVLITGAILVYAFLVYCQNVVYKSGLCPMRCLKVYEYVLSQWTAPLLIDCICARTYPVLAAFT